MRRAEAAGGPRGRPLAALAEVARWPNALIAAAGVLVGAWWANPSIPTPAPLWAALAAVALTVFANAFNDHYDIEIDRVAHPERPLPRGALTDRQVQNLYLGAAVAAAGFSLLAHPALCLLSLAVLALMAIYSMVLKRWGLVGNVVVALLASLPFLYGAVSVGNWRAGIELLVVAAPLHLAREITKDIEDVRGDAQHRRTIPLAHGARAAQAAVLLALALFAWRAALLAGSRPRLASALIPCFVLCALGAKRMLASRPGAPLLLKTAMVAAMVAIVLTR